MHIIMQSEMNRGSIDSPIQLWVDTDPSGLYHTGLDCDDDLAILVALALHRRQIIQLDGISICGGNAPLRHTWNDIQRLWNYVDGFQRTGITPLKGYGWRSMQVGVKLLQWYNTLFPDVANSDDASLAIVERILGSSEQQTHQKGWPLTILALGPPTNIAKAIKQYKKEFGGLPSTYKSNIDHIYLMGGELTNRQLDLNFRSDRASARTVLEADVPKTIVPIQTCGQVSVTESWLRSLDCPALLSSSSPSISDNGGGQQRLAVCAYLSKMRQQVRWMPIFVNRAVKERMIVPASSDDLGSSNSNVCELHWGEASPNLDTGFIPWDIIALLTISHPKEFSEWRYHRVSMSQCTGGEPCDGTMEVLEDLGDEFDGSKSRGWSGVVRIPHGVRNETRLLEIMLDLIKEVEVSSPLEEEPHMYWGFATDVAGFVIVTIIFLFCCFSMDVREIWRSTKR